MGRKPTGKRKFVYICFTLIMSGLMTTACAHLQSMESEGEARRYIVQAKTSLSRGDYATAVNENEKALSLSKKAPPSDEALFNIGAIYADIENPGRDLIKSAAAFRKMARGYPQGPWVESAGVIAPVVEELIKLKRLAAEMKQENEKLKRLAAEMKQENEKLKRLAAEMKQENEKLKQMIQQSKKVDIEVEEMRREKAR